MQGRLEGSLCFMCWVCSSPAKTRKLWEQSALFRGEEVSPIPFPQSRNSFCWVMSEATYIICGQKAELACFWVTGIWTKRKISKFPSWPQTKNLPLGWHLVHIYCVIWFCTECSHWDYLCVTVSHLQMGFLGEDASVSELSCLGKGI